MSREPEWTEQEEEFFRRGDSLADEVPDDFSDLDEEAPRGPRLGERITAGLRKHVALLRSSLATGRLAWTRSKK